jgi:hypothetical protein
MSSSIGCQYYFSNSEVLSYAGKEDKLQKIWWHPPELNWGHMDFQSTALPTELGCHFTKKYLCALKGILK